MAKNLKLNIKNTQIAEAINLSSLKSKLAKKKAEDTEEAKPAVKTAPTGKSAKTEATEHPKEVKEEAPRIRARTKSAFSEGAIPESKYKAAAQETPVESASPTDWEAESPKKAGTKSTTAKSGDELRKELFGEDVLIEQQVATPLQTAEAILGGRGSSPQAAPETKEEPLSQPVSKDVPAHKKAAEPSSTHQHAHAKSHFEKPRLPVMHTRPTPKPVVVPPEPRAPHVRLGPTGRHINDLLTPKPRETPARQAERHPQGRTQPPVIMTEEEIQAKAKAKGRESGAVPTDEDKKKGPNKAPAKFKEFRDVKPARKGSGRSFDARDRQGLRDSEDERWRKKRHGKQLIVEETPDRPTTLKVRTPISLKDLASEMKLKASQLIAKLFMQGVVVTLNDLLEDETTIQLLGHEFGCEITIDTSEKERIRITDKSIKEEVQTTDPSLLKPRPPVVAFMGHVDHGKTSLIDMIRKSNRAAGEAGAITQHIGAFRCSTAVGDIAILDTPGHEAFSAMRARGADVTDIVVLVVAGDEGIRQQTIEAINHAKAAKVTIVVAINKCDKPNFNAENVYRQLSEQELLPEAWGGQTITVNCSAVSGEGIQTLLEMLALQSDVLELKADPTARARGAVLESEMHKGMGSVATVLVQNGTLKIGDCIVFDNLWGRVKTMRDEFGRQLLEAGPSTPVEITGLSGLPEAGHDFIAVKTEKEARDIAEERMLGMKQTNLQLKKKLTMENLVQQASEVSKKNLNLVLRADVQGSLEALKAALMKIQSTKAELNIIFTGVGEISESDVQLAAASKAVIVGFHTKIESHAEVMMKELGIQARLHDIIYHAVDDVKGVLAGLLDKIPLETEKGAAEVKATFKSSHAGIIAGCMVTEGSITRNNNIRIKRGNEVIWKGTISSLKRVKEDVKEVLKGLECGIVLKGFSDVQAGDIIEAYEITYITQEL